MRFFTAVLALVPAAAIAAAPVADLEGDARVVELAGSGTHYRLSRGQALTLRLSGPASLSFELRAEGHAPRAVAPVAEQDGKAIPVPPVDVTTDPALRSEKGGVLTRATLLRVEVAAGRHAVTLRWPGAASGDTLIAIRGVQVALLPDLGLPPLTIADLPPLALPTALANETESAATHAAPASGASSRSLSGTHAVVLANASPSKTQASPARSDGLALTPLALPAAGPQPGTRMITVLAVPPEADFSRFSLDVHAGAQRSAESYTSAATLGDLGVDLAFRLTPLLSLLASVDGRLSRQAYQARQTALDGRGLAHADVDERRLDAFLGAGWDVGTWLVKSGRLELVPLLGGQTTLVRNSGFPLDLAGPSAGVRARFALSTAFALQAGARFTYNLLKGDTLSVVGSPVSDLSVRAGVSLPLAGQYSFDVGYQGDVLALHYDTRVAHGVALGFHSGF